jgi:murein DD-endopeptidase MepM/ murein hydrolase activator NlpD
MLLSSPIKNIQPSPPIAPTPDAIYTSQRFGNVWIANKDFKLNGVQVYKGDNVYKKLFGWDGHNGWDIAAPRGTPIASMSSGYVIEATAKDSGYGIRVSILFEQDGYQWVLVYGHMLSTALPDVPYNFNDRRYKVKRGDILGYVDSTGASTGDHLHVSLYQYKDGVRLNNNNGFGGALDPQKYVKKYFMEILQIEAEQTLVIRNLDGKYLIIATTPEFYPLLSQKLGLEGKNFGYVTRAEVEANKIGELKAGFSIV